MQKVLRFLKRQGWPTYLTIGCLLAVGYLLLFRLGSLTTHLSSAELAQQQFSSSWRHIIHNPLNLPYTALQWLFLTIIPHHGVTVTRLASICFGGAGLLAFTYVVRRWYGSRTAVFGAVLFATSSWFLHISRYGDSGVLYLWAIPTLLAAQIAWERHAARAWVGWLVVAILGLLLYVPGMIWLVVLSFGLQPAQLVRSWQHTRAWWHWVIIVIVAGLFLTPLILAIARDTSLLQMWAGLPKQYASAGHIGRQLVHSVSFLGYRGPNDPQRWLDRLPVLDLFSLVMFILGVIFYVRHIVAPRTRQLAALWVVGAIFFALGGPVTYSVLVPLAYLISTAGIGYLLHEWLHVFPRNTLARSFGYGLLGLVVLMASVYNLRSYYIAWPHSLHTIAVYQIPRR